MKRKNRINLVDVLGYGWASKTRSALWRYRKVLYLDELLKLTEDDLWRTYGIGPESVRLIKDRLKERGLALRGETK